jgi:hypothetical protein
VRPSQRHSGHSNGSSSLRMLRMNGSGSTMPLTFADHLAKPS